MKKPKGTLTAEELQEHAGFIAETINEYFKECPGVEFVNVICSAKEGKGLTVCSSGNARQEMSCIMLLDTLRVHFQKDPIAGLKAMMTVCPEEDRENFIGRIFQDA